MVEETLSDKIERIDDGAVFHEVCYVNAVKEKIQNAQRRLKDLIVSFVYGDNPPNIFRKQKQEVRNSSHA